MGQNTTFVTFDEVCTRLNIDETKLKRLVSEGAFRAFREGGQMKFREKDIENFSLEEYEERLAPERKESARYGNDMRPCPSPESDSANLDEGSNKAPPRATGCAVLLGAIVIALALAGGVAFALS